MEDSQSVKTALKTATALLQDGRQVDAEKATQEILENDPDNEDALYLLAVCQRYLKQYDTAFSTIQKLIKLQPAYGRAFQEEGHILTAIGSAGIALQAYRHAVSLNNSLIASWKALAECGNSNLADDAKIHYDKLAALPPELLSVRNMTAERRYFKAERLCRNFLQSNPQNVEAMRLLADLGVKSGVLDDAEFILESAVEFEPHNLLARHDYMTVLYRRQKYEESLEQARILRKADPDNLDYKISYANQAVAVGDYDSALQIYTDAIALRPNSAELHLVHGHALKTIGQLDDAIDAYRHTYRSRPSFGDAYWSLANLKTYRFSDEEVSSMREMEESPWTEVEDRAHFCFALGKHYEDAQDFAESAGYYEQGNSLRKSQLRYDSAHMTERLNLQKEQCTEAMFAAKSGYGCDTTDPIFIVGLPRAGSTLLEQILASHSQVDGTLELPNIPALAFRLGGRRQTEEEPRYPAILHDLTAEQCKKFGEDFIADTQVHRQGAAFFIDKMLHLDISG